VEAPHPPAGEVVEFGEETEASPPPAAVMVEFEYTRLSFAKVAEETRTTEDKRDGEREKVKHEFGGAFDVWELRKDGILSKSQIKDKKVSEAAQLATEAKAAHKLAQIRASQQ
jgi:hypothetical protein